MGRPLAWILLAPLALGQAQVVSPSRVEQLLAQDKPALGEHLFSRRQTVLQYAPNGRNSSERGRRLQAAVEGDWAPIRIHLHTESLDEDVSAEDARYLREDVLESAVRWLEQVLYVRPVVGNLQFEQRCDLVNTFGACAQVSVHPQRCGDTVIPKEHQRDLKFCKSGLELFCEVAKGGPGIPNADFALYVTAKDNDVCRGGAAAHGNTCQQDQKDRPIAGNLNFCSFHLRTDRRWSTTIATAVHEILHTIGFASSMFAFFRTDDGAPRTARDENGNPPYGSVGYEAGSSVVTKRRLVDGTEKRYLVLPRVVEAARRHYGCSTLTEVPLEDTGSDGTRFSHWDDRYMYSEIMTPDVNVVPRLSELTMALFEDSGWYKPDYSKAGSFLFGKKRGCAFLQESCVVNGSTKFPETFCTAGSGSCGYAGVAGCAHDLMAKAGCTKCEHSEALPERFRYFSNNPRLGGTRKQMNYCPSWEPWLNSWCMDSDSASDQAQYYGEAFTANSRCIMSRVIQRAFVVPSRDLPSCRQVSCQRGYVLIAVGNDLVNCSAAEAGTRKGPGGVWAGTLVCPSYTHLCGADGTEGPGAVPCRFPGTLRHGRCVCSAGYIGEDCSVRDTAVNRPHYPFGLRYPQSDLALTVGKPLESAAGITSWPVRPSVVQGAMVASLRFSASPPLPLGLSLSPEDGTLSGTPTGAAPRKAYSIIVRGGKGAATTTVFIDVKCEEGKSDCVAAPTPAPTPAPFVTMPSSPTPAPPPTPPPVVPAVPPPTIEQLLRVLLPRTTFFAVQFHPGLHAFATEFASVVSTAVGQKVAASSLSALLPQGLQVDLRVANADGLRASSVEFQRAVDGFATALEDSGSNLRSTSFAEQYLQDVSLLKVTSDGLVQVWPKPEEGESMMENIQRRWPLYAVLAGFILFICLVCTCGPACLWRRKCLRKRRSGHVRDAAPRDVSGSTLRQAAVPVVYGVPVPGTTQPAAGGDAAPVQRPPAQQRPPGQQQRRPTQQGPRLPGQPSARSDEAMTTLLEMGYEFEPALAALQANNWDVRRAVTALGAG